MTPRQGRRRRLIVTACVVSMLAAGGLAATALPQPPVSQPLPDSADLRVRVGARGQDTVDLLGGTVVSPQPSPVSQSVGCTAVAPYTIDGHDGAHGYQISGRWLVDLPERDRAARLAAVHTAWTTRGYETVRFYSSGVGVLGYDPVWGLHLNIYATTGSGALQVTVTSHCYELRVIASGPHGVSAPNMRLSTPARRRVPRPQATGTPPPSDRPDDLRVRRGVRLDTLLACGLFAVPGAGGLACLTVYLLMFGDSCPATEPTSCHPRPQHVVLSQIAFAGAVLIALGVSVITGRSPTRRRWLLAGLGVQVVIAGAIYLTVFTGAGAS